MTSAQVTYLANQEAARHNREMEAIERRNALSRSRQADASVEGAEASKLSARASMQKSNTGLLDTAVKTFSTYAASRAAAKLAKNAAPKAFSKMPREFASARQTGSKAVAGASSSSSVIPAAASTAASIALPVLGIAVAAPFLVAAGKEWSAKLQDWDSRSDAPTLTRFRKDAEKLAKESFSVDPSDGKAVKNLKIKFTALMNKIKKK